MDFALPEETTRLCENVDAFMRQARMALVCDGPDDGYKTVVARRILAQYERK